MTQHNCTVTEGYVYTPDSEGKVLETYTRHNLQAKPTVTVDTVGAIDTEDLVDDAVDVDKLATALVQKPDSLNIVVANQSGNDITVTINVLDLNGDELADVCILRLWLSDSAAGAPSADYPDGGQAVSTGLELIAAAADTIGTYQTDENGELVIVFTDTGGGVVFHISAEMVNKQYSGNQALTWA